MVPDVSHHSIICEVHNIYMPQYNTYLHGQLLLRLIKTDENTFYTSIATQ